MKFKPGLLLVFLTLIFSTAGADESHPFSVEDMLAMDRISDPQVSPNGKWIVFNLRTTDLDANRGRTDLWQVGTDGQGLRRLTTNEAADYNPRWAPDGKKIWFLSTRSGSSQIWSIPSAGGEAVQASDFPLDVTGLIVSPDGGHLALSMEVFPGKSPEETGKILDEKEADKASGRIYDKIFIRHWDTWKDGRRSHLFVKAVGDEKVRDLMPEMDADTPSKPFGGPEEITFTRDGKGLVFTARDAGPGEPWSTDFNLYYVPIDGTVAPRNLTKDNQAWDTMPAFSPDGKTLVYLAMKRPRFEADRFRIVSMSWPDGGKKILTEDWDRSPSSITWTDNGRSLLVTAPNLGQSSLFEIDAESGSVRTLIEQGYIGSPSQAGARIIFGLDHLKSPVEIYSSDLNGGNIKPITRINTEKIATAAMGDADQFTFKGWGEETVYAYVVKPVDFSPGKKYPVAFLIHGGPQGSFGNHFHYRWNPQTYTGAGYAAVMVDFHGSVGYGQAFTDSISRDWGGKPFEDLKKGLAAALERYSWLDGDRVAALGASFGGYMINWIAGNWPDRFRCLINHDGNLDERAAYFNTEELWFPEWDHGGTPWDNPDGYEKHNPVNFVKNWKTPMLVIHGALDYRVVETQGIATFNALQRLGIPSRFLYFPDENHWVLKPWNSILWHKTVIEWMNRWCK